MRHSTAVTASNPVLVGESSAGHAVSKALLQASLLDPEARAQDLGRGYLQVYPKAWIDPWRSAANLRMSSPLSAGSGMRIPGDFDVTQITWRPDYDPFFYRQLSHRARRIYLFRDEYVFDVEKAVVVEIPQLGHATYVFAKPRSMDCFLSLYTRITKDDVRRNRNNAAERLGFLGTLFTCQTQGHGQGGQVADRGGN